MDTFPSYYSAYNYVTDAYSSHEEINNNNANASPCKEQTANILAEIRGRAWLMNKIDELNIPTTKKRKRRIKKLKSANIPKGYSHALRDIGNDDKTWNALNVQKKIELAMNIKFY